MNRHRERQLLRDEASCSFSHLALSSSADLANIPGVSKDGARGLERSIDIRSQVGRIPKIPQNDEGTRTEPPVSDLLSPQK